MGDRKLIAASINQRSNI